jgi:hypothetical protein
LQPCEWAIRPEFQPPKPETRHPEPHAMVQEGALKKIVEAIAAKAATDCSSPIGTGTDQAATAASAAATPTSSDVGGAGNSDVVTPDTAWTSSLGWSADVADEGGASGGVDEYSMSAPAPPTQSHLFIYLFILYLSFGKPGGGYT